MKNLLRLEELAQFLFCGFWMYFLGVPWWCYLLLLLGPDIGMLGYLVNSRVGSISYNLLHHKGLALVVWMRGSFPWIAAAAAGGIAFMMAAIALRLPNELALTPLTGLAAFISMGVRQMLIGGRIIESE